MQVVIRGVQGTLLSRACGGEASGVYRLSHLRCRPAGIWIALGLRWVVRRHCDAVLLRGCTQRDRVCCGGVVRPPPGGEVGDGAVVPAGFIQSAARLSGSVRPLIRVLTVREAALLVNQSLAGYRGLRIDTSE